jgi:hypothetical protein
MNVILPENKHKSANKNITEVLSPVTEVLFKSYKLLQQVARRATNKSLQTIIYGLAEEANKHYRELASQFQVSPNYFQQADIILFSKEKRYDNSEELINDCSAIENAIERCYESLSDNVMMKREVRFLLQQHLNRFLSAFDNLKVLKNYSLHN